MGKITPLVLHFDAVCLWMVPALPCVCECVFISAHFGYLQHLKALYRVRGLIQAGGF